MLNLGFPATSGHIHPGLLAAEPLRLEESEGETYPPDHPLHAPNQPMQRPEPQDQKEKPPNIRAEEEEEEGDDPESDTFESEVIIQRSEEVSGDKVFRLIVTRNSSEED